VVVVQPPPPVRKQRARYWIDDPIISMVGIAADPSARGVASRFRAEEGQ